MAKSQNYNIIRRPQAGIMCIRAYCTKCGKMLMESRNLTKKQLLSVWDRSVIQAVQIECKDCHFKFPNFNIELRIANSRTDREYPPEKYIRLKHKEDPVELFKSVSKQWLREHPETTPPTQEEIIEAVKRQREQQAELQNHGEESANGEGD